MAEPIPARGAQLVEAPLRHDVIVPKQDAVERLGGGGKIIVALGEDDMLDHRINRRVFDADHVVRACLVGRLRAKIVAQLVPGNCVSRQAKVMMSKSQLRSRFSYCAASTVRTVTVMPRRSSEGL